MITIADDSRTLGELGEFGLIRALTRRLPPSPRALVGIGDDAAVLATPDGRVVATTDFLLEGRHFRRDWSTGRDVGHKAAARSLADVAAMGAAPTALLVALAAPPDLPVGWALDLAAGLAAECERAGASVIGGDTAQAPDVRLAVTGLGDLAGRSPVLRSGAAPGDVVAVAGPLGHSAAGFALLSAGLVETVPSLVAGLREAVPSLVAAHLRPGPEYDAGPEAASLGATAMIDVSDGLLADLGHVARASGVLIDLDPAPLRPVEVLLEAAQAVSPSRRHDHNHLIRTRGGSPARPDNPDHAQALRWVLTGGEDHSLVATFPPGVPLPARWTVIGRVLSGQGVLVAGQPWQCDLGQGDLGRGGPGWDHFA